ncbi:4Fe-4S binding protein, partial [Methanococcoides sp. SA1]|nr:4Fe-4S binding protein [Methanococcoides sp. SA1]
MLGDIMQVISVNPELCTNCGACV